MSDDAVDYYDVQSMIRDATVNLRNEFEVALRELRIEIQDEFRHADDKIVKFVNQRTEHLA